MAEDPYEKFRTLLNLNYQFPAKYLHKFIGKNSPLFIQSVAEFEKKFIGLDKITERRSASDAHISLTYEYLASSADDVILLTSETQRINDIIFIL